MECKLSDGQRRFQAARAFADGELAPHAAIVFEEPTHLPHQFRRRDGAAWQPPGRGGAGLPDWSLFTAPPDRAEPGLEISSGCER